MRPLRYGFWWFAGGVVLVAFVLYSTLAPGVNSPSFIDDKMAHFVSFAALMAWFSGVFRRRMLPLVALLLAGLGIGIELLQAQLTYRTAEFADAFSDFGGIAIAWAVAFVGLGRWAELVESRVLRQSS